jgi:hypothetical protein
MNGTLWYSLACAGRRRNSFAPPLQPFVAKRSTSVDVDLSTLPREASSGPSLDQSRLSGEGAASPSKNSSSNSALDKMSERPVRPLASGEYEDQRVEQIRRAQWIRHLFAQKQYKEAEDIGWDLEDDPRPTMKDGARRALWIKYFVDSWLFEEAVMVGWDEETPPDPRPRRIFCWTGGVYTGFDTYRCRETVRIEGLCDEAAIVAVKVVSSMRFEIKMTVRVLAGPKAGEVKKLKIRCDKLLNFENLTKTWEQVKKASAAQRAAAAR